MGSTRVRPRSVRLYSTRRGASAWRSTRPYCWSRRNVWVRILREMVAAGFLDPRPTPFPAGTPLTIFRYQSFEHTLDAVVVKRMAAFLNAGVRLGALRPAIDKVFALDDIVEAHRHLEKGLHAGKIVVTV